MDFGHFYIPIFTAMGLFLLKEICSRRADDDSGKHFIIMGILLLPITAAGIAASIAAAIWLVYLLLEPTSAVLSWPSSLRIFLILAALTALLWLTTLPVRFLGNKLRFNRKKRILTAVCMLLYYLIELTVFFIVPRNNI